MAIYRLSKLDEFGYPIPYRSASAAGCNLLRTPTEGLVFYDKLNAASSVADSGQEYDVVGDIIYSKVDGVDCATFNSSQGLYTSGENVIGGHDPRTFIFKFRLNDNSSRPEDGYIAMGLGDGRSGVGSHYELCISPTDDDFFGFSVACWGKDTNYFEDFYFERNKWYVVALTYDGNSDERFHVDGKFIASRYHSGLNTANQELAVGASPGWERVAQGFDGSIAYAYIYNRVLTDEEISNFR